jgi:hydroxyethylthiazole kinase-like uncharacterized protein yjeF
VTEILSSAQMRSIEQAEIDSGNQSGADLMALAGRGIVQAIGAYWPHFAMAPHRAQILCGPGNNGGDGYVVARLLLGMGWQVTCHALGVPSTRDAAQARQNFATMGGRIIPLQSETLGGAGADLVIDALFGIGLRRPVQGLDAIARAIAANRAQVLAVDLPTGLCADSGRALGAVLPADLTVTFAHAKPGHYLDQGPAFCGALRIAPLNLRAEMPPGVLRKLGPPLPALIDKGQGHKFDHGHALVLTGGMGRTGAARLAARAALGMGAGLVTLGAPGPAMMEVACQITSLMLTRCDDAPTLSDLLADPRVTALCAGPGLGLDRARALVPVLLASGKPAVLDADALSAFADDPDTLFNLLHSGCVLTPHGGEFARLFPDLATALRGPAQNGPAPDKITATCAAAARAGCAILFKGHDTVIAMPDGRAWLHAASYDRAAPWLATAGAGDVLAGMIAGQLARGAAPHDAACASAWLHVEAARMYGPGLTAEALVQSLPAALRAAINSP